jgi:hypothetical protein
MVVTSLKKKPVLINDPCEEDLKIPPCPSHSYLHHPHLKDRIF